MIRVVVVVVWLTNGVYDNPYNKGIDNSGGDNNSNNLKGFLKEIR